MVKFQSIGRKCTSVAAIVMAALISSCGSKTEAPTPDYGNNYGDLKYKINGVKDLTMERIGEGTMQLSIERTSGKIEDIMMAVRNLPAGATATFTPITIGKPSFNTMLTIKCTRVKAGTYDVIVRGSSQSSGFTDSTMTLTVLPYSNAADGLIGLFREQAACTQGGNIGDTVDVEKDQATPNRVNFKGLWSGVWSNIIYANLNPTDNTLVIPAQSINGVTFSGNGTFDDNTIIISYRVAGATVNDTCTSTLSRL
ncbi:MAG TPA: hypothetical protein VGD89_11365 [Flavipsychrobacter sp.]